ncbi:hypothetical protein ANCDUO_03254 [Ancylostoma duodenale]|uniref:Uncharacterized protein n=1 Tax=Ancylostoma duodenale TaxID=51022 RepID=A0A0C2GY43_9BILA|nr:hypothetical protein ANCDUO_03254 [Ancylostoma duodenale]
MEKKKYICGALSKRTETDQNKPARRVPKILGFLFHFIFLISIYSGSILPYQYHVRVLELLIILAFAPIEAIRLSWGTRGNLTETPAFLAFSLLLSFPVMLIHVYLAIFQNYGEFFLCGTVSPQVFISLPERSAAPIR